MVGIIQPPIRATTSFLASSGKGDMVSHPVGLLGHSSSHLRHGGMKCHPNYAISHRFYLFLCGTVRSFTAYVRRPTDFRSGCQIAEISGFFRPLFQSGPTLAALLQRTNCIETSRKKRWKKYREGKGRREGARRN